ncbi:hypothetical protein [Vibrio metschnikovii]|uniref:hypothetical protein n=1 Tax=Vibrio metschnikovii TaxID=28172 RepID=UPI001C2F5A2B|nr:hypothetical protein [Vibrio metschnikovii]MDA3140167.1 hypothetical protein [Vibrio metschnikovii]
MDKFTLQVAPKSQARYNAGSYDPILYMPKYDVEMFTPYQDVQGQVDINRVVMGSKGAHFLVLEIKNNSTWPVFLSVTKDGVLMSNNK